MYNCCQSPNHTGHDAPADQLPTGIRRMQPEGYFRGILIKSRTVKKSINSSFSSYTSTPCVGLCLDVVIAPFASFALRFEHHLLFSSFCCKSLSNPY